LNILIQINLSGKEIENQEKKKVDKRYLLMERRKLLQNTEK